MSHLTWKSYKPGINFFSNRIVAIYNDEGAPSETELDDSTEES